MLFLLFIPSEFGAGLTVGMMALIAVLVVIVLLLFIVATILFCMGYKKQGNNIFLITCERNYLHTGH